MKTIKKFTETKTVKKVEKEIELPAYFLTSDNKPSDITDIANDYLNIVCIVDENKTAIRITLGPGYHSGEQPSNNCSYSDSCWSNYEIVSRFTQTTKEEWEIAKSFLINDIQSK